MANEKIIFDTEVKVGSSVGSVKSLKAELRAVTNELGNLEEGSAAFVAAAQKAGQLRDKIGDVKNTINAFNPEKKFQAIADSVGIAANGFAALQGGMALFGSESEDLNKVMVKTQGAIALATGLNGLLGMKDALNNLKLTTYSAISGLSGMVTGIGGLSGALNALKTTLLTNPLFVLGAIIISIGVALKSFYDGLSSGVEIYKSTAKAVADLKKSYTSLIDEIKDLQIENDLANGKITEKDAILLREKNKFKKEFLAILKDANDKEAEIREQAAKERDDDGFKGTKNLLDKLGFETATTKASKQSLEDIERQKQENIAALRKKYSLVNSNTTIEENKKEDDRRLAKEAKEKAIRDKEKADAESKAKAIFESNKFWAGEADKTLKALSDKKLKDGTDAFEAEISAVTAQIETSTSLYYKEAKAKKEIDEASIEAKKQMYQATSSILGTLSGLVGAQTEEGKMLAVAQATINTYLGASEAFTGSLKIDPSGILGSVLAGAAVLTGLANVKNILSVQVPSKNGGGGGGGGLSPTAPRIPQSINGTILTQNKPITTTTVGGVVGKVIVVETDITQTQDKVKNIIRKATIK